MIAIPWTSRVRASWDPQQANSALPGDLMEIKSGQLAGSQGVNCGRVAIRENPKAATDCGLSSFKAKKAFRVRYDLHGIDSNLAAGLVLSPNGKLFELYFDSDPSGGGHSQNQQCQVMTCPQPYALHVTKTGKLFCSQHFAEF
jgi:hypothetical protein